jgi:hypothetical protein
MALLTRAYASMEVPRVQGEDGVSFADLSDLLGQIAGREVSADVPLERWLLLQVRPFLGQDLGELAVYQLHHHTGVPRQLTFG